jgi:hypothetical protein
VKKGSTKPTPYVFEQSIIYFIFLYISKSISLKEQRAAALLQRRYKRQTPYLGEKEEQKSKYSEQLERKKKKKKKEKKKEKRIIS